MAEIISLKKGPGGTAHVRVSMVGVWQKLEALKALADQATTQGVPVSPEKICEWADQFWQELGECNATYITFRGPK
jgi:hypothetical protein